MAAGDPNRSADFNNQVVNSSNDLNNLALARDNKAIDKIADLVANKLKDKKLNGEESKKSSILTTILKIQAFLALSFILLYFFSIFIYISKSSNAENQQPGASSDDLDNKMFKHESGQKFKYNKVVGQDRILRKCLRVILKHQAWINNLKQSECEKIIDSSNMSFLLSGPPGTGKTIFVKTLAYKVDIMLRKKYLLKTQGKAFVDELKNIGNYDHYIDKMPSRVRYYYITPSLINDMYVGQSEKRIRTLFKEAKNITESLFVTMIMFDEADSFFGSRTTGRPSHSGELACKSEFLMNLSQFPDGFKSMFVFAATNIPQSFDSAFKRRFGTEIKFTLPNDKRREDLINEVYAEAKLSKSDVSKIVKLTGGKSQSYITKKLRNYIEYDENGNFVKVNVKNLLNDLTRGQQDLEAF